MHPSGKGKKLLAVVKPLVGSPKDLVEGNPINDMAVISPELAVYLLYRTAMGKSLFFNL